MAQERRSTRRTGGGPPLRMEYTTYEEELRQIMPAEIVEGINVQDTDSPSFGQVVDSPGPQFSPSARPTPPPSARDSGTDEQAGPSSYQPPQAESLEMSPEPEDQTTITLVTVDAPVSGLQEVSPGPAEPSHHQPAVRFQGYLSLSAEAIQKLPLFSRDPCIAQIQRSRVQEREYDFFQRCIYPNYKTVDVPEGVQVPRKHDGGATRCPERISGYRPDKSLRTGELFPTAWAPPQTSPDSENVGPDEKENDENSLSPESVHGI
ncbi:UPF0575 protein C19orf67 homolog [Mixophyes fleayi]|uniref:UPF0575 protein C19orf67 homolog n=1 Tax=Mixophyes fleayi TaxID=3061075 RepID=UPI003F4D8F97